MEMTRHGGGAGRVSATRALQPMRWNTNSRVSYLKDI